MHPTDEFNIHRPSTASRQSVDSVSFTQNINQIYSHSSIENEDSFIETKGISILKLMICVLRMRRRFYRAQSTLYWLCTPTDVRRAGVILH